MVLAFFLGIFIEWKKPFPYNKLREIAQDFNKDINKKDIDHDQDCIYSYELSNENLRNNDELSLIIGHAYGNPRNKNYDLSPRLNDFINEIEKQKKFEKIYFTGDVFDIPSRKKWEKLLNRFSDRIQVAPGNHDIGIGENTKKDIFFDFFPNYPIQENYESNVLLIFNTIDTNSSLSEENLDYLIDKVRNNPGKTFFILGHNILRPNPEKISNYYEYNPITTSNNKNLMMNLALLNSFGNKIFFISGDTGGTNDKPRLNCFMDKNISFISSGIGDHKDDVVLIKKGASLYYSRINQ
tara:strand:+ start:668 stop:1555 length:888 start_codon:yes stop_codon:yes gene_type:complete